MARVSGHGFLNDFREVSQGVAGIIEEKPVKKIGPFLNEQLQQTPGNGAGIVLDMLVRIGGAAVFLMNSPEHHRKNPHAVEQLHGRIEG